VGKASNRKKSQTRAERVGKRTKQARLNGPAPVNIVDIGVAHHEAAHAVVGTLLGIEHEYVELIEEDGGVRGFTRDVPPQWLKDWVASHGTNALDDGQRAYLHAYMVATLAGALADRQFRDVLGPDNDQDPRSDVGQVSTMLWAVVGGDDKEPVQCAMDRLREETAALLEKHWSQVQVVAAALTQRRRLTGAEVAALLDGQARVEWRQSTLSP
jgi:hypothetical protein